jgi:quercetin dioxygenase-like cupin family protein
MVALYLLICAGA